MTAHRLAEASEARRLHTHRAWRSDHRTHGGAGRGTGIPSTRAVQTAGASSLFGRGRHRKTHGVGVCVATRGSRRRSFGAIGSGVESDARDEHDGRRQRSGSHAASSEEARSLASGRSVSKGQWAASGPSPPSGSVGAGGRRTFPGAGGPFLGGGSRTDATSRGMWCRAACRESLRSLRSRMNGKQPWREAELFGVSRGVGWSRGAPRLRSSATSVTGGEGRRARPRSRAERAETPLAGQSHPDVVSRSGVTRTRTRVHADAFHREVTRHGFAVEHRGCRVRGGGRASSRVS